MSKQERIAQAARMYVRRRDRVEHPAGAWDRAGRWYPTAEETCPECRSIREPSRAWPMTLNRHCRSLPHIAALCGVEPREVRAYLREVRQASPGLAYAL